MKIYLNTSRGYMFNDYDRMVIAYGENGFIPEDWSYVYKGDDNDYNNNLDEVYRVFNCCHPKGYFQKFRSLSCGDIVEMDDVKDGKVTHDYYMCDSFGWQYLNDKHKEFCDALEKNAYEGYQEEVA